MIYIWIAFQFSHIFVIVIQEQVGDSTQNNTVSDDSDNTDALVIEEDRDEDDFLMDLFNDTNKNQSKSMFGGTIYM